MSRHDEKLLEACSALYAKREVDVSCFPALWHTYKVGQLMATDLDRICRRYGLSMADVHLLSAVRVEGSMQLRATDLAQRLDVSNAVLSTRLAKLERNGLLERIPSATDRRAFEVKLTPGGVTTIDAASEDIGRSATFSSCYRALAEEDRNALARTMGELHNQLARRVGSISR
jgi:DNA-binding MarR family transcriptional regulator